MAVNVLIMGDTHGGAAGGLLPPPYWSEQLKVMQSLAYGWWLEAITEFGPWDVGLFTGDATDGEGKKGTMDTVIPDTLEQAASQEEIYAAPGIEKQNMYFVRGTPFHSSGTYNYEDPLAKALGASIENEQLVSILGLKIHLRHALGRSDTAYGQGTPLFRESIRDLVDATLSEQEPADIVIRGHVHYSCRMTIGKRTEISAPCMEYPDSVFGRTCRGMYYDMGIGKLVVRSATDWEYHPILMPLKVVKRREYKEICSGEEFSNGR